MKLPTRPLELGYQGINHLRRGLYRRGILKTRALPRPVVSIGNIAIGGSGKTPAAIAVARHLTRIGYRVAILTRGYGGSETSGWALVDVPDARRFGDEPVVIAERLPECRVIVGADRYRAGIEFLGLEDCDVFILDDGFQHLQLHRDLDIVIDDPTARWNREGRSALRDADVVLLRAASSDGGPTPEDPRVRAVLEASGFRKGETRGRLEELRGKKCLAMSGLARNGRFFDMLSEAGIDLVGAYGFPDHHDYSAADLSRVVSLRDSTGAELILTTEKDAVKLPAEFECTIIEADMKFIPEEAFYSLVAEELLRLQETRA